MTYRVEKTIGPLSCAFRNWRASESHCSYLHGYGLEFTFRFEGGLDDRGWVIDFGGFKAVRHWLEAVFDHKTLVADDDPEIEVFRSLAQKSIIDLTIVDSVGCEAFAALAASNAEEILEIKPYVRLAEVECREHRNNAAVRIMP